MCGEYGRCCPFFRAARCEKGLYKKFCPFVLVCAGVGSSDISRICKDNTNKGGCVYKLNENF